jgi:hypothetical protein
MSYAKDQQYKVTAADATTATLQPVLVAGTPAPSTIVCTWAARPADFVVNAKVSVQLRTDQ